MLMLHFIVLVQKFANDWNSISRNHYFAEHIARKFPIDKPDLSSTFNESFYIDNCSSLPSGWHIQSTFCITYGNVWS
jgi:hypothetical protein